MKSLKSFIILVSVLLLQGCLPDSFTKFKEEPSVRAEGGSGGTASALCPSGSQLTDPFCLKPTRIEYTEDLEFNIDAETLDQDILIKPNVFNASPVEGFAQYFTFTITPSLPASTGLAFDIETGIISGVPQTYYEGVHVVSAEYRGDVPVSLTDTGEVANIDISIATTLQPLLTFENPIDKIVVLNLDDVTPFIGRTWVSAEEENGAAQIQFIDQVTNQIHIDTDIVGSSGLFILRTQNELALDNRESFSSQKAISQESVIAMTPAQSLTVDDGALSTAIFTSPAGELTNLSQEELETIVYSINPAIGNGLIFTEETTCYDLTIPSTPVALSSRALCDSGALNHQLVLGGTIWGDINVVAELPPTQYTITGTNIHGSQGSRTIQLSILSPAAPKALAEAKYRQQTGQKLKITVDDASAFENASTISLQEGKTATINGVDLDANQIFVTVNNEDDLYFKSGDEVDDSATFFAAETVISEVPTFFYDDSVIDDTSQPFLKTQLAPLSIFESTSLPDIAETRSLRFTITPNIELLGVNFQGQSGCYDISADPNDPSTWVEQLDGSSNPDFTDCDAATPNFLEIRGGTVWGQFNPASLPLSEREFTVTGVTLAGVEVIAPFKMETTPGQEPAEFSYTQDVLLRLQTTSNFKQGDYISNSGGGVGIVKEDFDANSSTFLWVHVVNGSFIKEESVDNKLKYKNQRGYVTEVHPINAKLTASGAIAVNDIVNDDDDENNQISNAGGATARLVFQSATNDLYVRVTEGVFTTGETLLDDAGASLAQTISNINAQNLILDVTNFGALTPQPGIDSSLVYSPDTNGDLYTGVTEVRNISGTTLEVEMIKGELGLADDLYLANPYELSDNDSISINSISTNNARYTFYKNIPVVMISELEPGFNASSYTIEPSLPPGLGINPTTGAITGTPTDRSEFISYTVTVSNEFDNPSYQPKEYNFSLEVKDYIAIFDTTENASTYILHKAGMGNGRKPCMITRDQLNSSSTLNRDIACFLEAGEQELFFEGMDLEVVFGEDMCQFIDQQPFITARFDAGSTAAPASEIHKGDYGVGACGGSSALDINPQGFCDFDYDFNADKPGYNCDEGEFDYTERAYTSFDACSCTSCDAGGEEFNITACGDCSNGDTSASQSECTDASAVWTAGSSVPACDEATSTISHVCGGAVPNCLEGAGAEISSKQDIFDFLILTNNTQNIEKIDVNVSDPFSSGFASNRYIASFINAPSCVGGNNFIYDFNTVASILKVRLQTANFDKEITAAFTGNAFYTFRCKDGSGDTQARIRLAVRDWNRSFRASDHIDKISPDADTILANDLMDRSGTDPNINFGAQMNSFIDLEFSGYSGSCGGSDLDSVYPDEITVPSRCTAPGDCTF
jgi:hypothetical protein